MHITHDPRAQAKRELAAQRRMLQTPKPFSFFWAVVFPAVLTFAAAYGAAVLVASIPMGG